MLNEVLLLGKISIVMPATSAVSKLPFSAFGRIKINLCPSITNNRLKYMMILHVHKDKLKSKTPILGNS